jgi:hypothetical protein
MIRAIRKEQSQESEDKTTADEAIKSERCAIPRQIYNEISTIASASKKTDCEVQIEVLRGWTELKKLQNECAQRYDLIHNTSFVNRCRGYTD